MVKAKKKKEQVARLTKMLKNDTKQKVSKTRSQYGIIKNLEGFFEYLNNRKVRIVKGTNPDLIYGVVQHPGYDGLVLSFSSEEIDLL